MAGGHMVQGANTMDDCIIEQNWDGYSAEEHGIWRTLFERQEKVLKGNVCQEYLDGLDALGITADEIPNFDRMNEELSKRTGWEVIPVPGLIPSRPFFDMLANRKFPSGNFIRKKDELDYLEEPDIFHDVFGHVPLLTNPAYADYMHAYGKAGDDAITHKGVKYLARLNWWTIEFGMIIKDGQPKIYGAGIASSFAETKYAASSPSPNFIKFDLERCLRTGYYIDDLQSSYFVIDSFEKLFEEAVERPFVPLYEEFNTMPDLNPFDFVDSDIILKKGDKEYWKDFPNTKTKLK